MSWIIAIIVGGLVGWIAYVVTAPRISLFWSVVVGMIGGVLVNIANFYGLAGATAVTLSLTGILAGVVGAVIALLIVEGVAAAYEPSKMAGPAYHEEIKEREKEDEKYHRR